MEAKDMITIPDAAKQSGVPKRTLYHAIKMGWLKTVRPEPPFLTTMEAVKDFITWHHVPRPRKSRL